MRTGKLLTQEQYDLINNQMYNDTNYFLAGIDTFDNLVIEMSQVDQITNPNFMWVKNCPEIEFDYKITPLPTS
jgi:hypothetical protein